MNYRPCSARVLGMLSRLERARDRVAPGFRAPFQIQRLEGGDVEIKLLSRSPDRVLAVTVAPSGDVLLRHVFEQPGGIGGCEFGDPSDEDFERELVEFVRAVRPREVVWFGGSSR